MILVLFVGSLCQLGYRLKSAKVHKLIDVGTVDYLLFLTILVFASFLYALGEMAYTSTFKQHHFILWIFSAMTSSLVGAFATLGLLVAIYLPISASCIYHKQHQYQEINSQAHGNEPHTINRSDPVDVPSHTTWDSPHSPPFGLMSSNELLVAT